MCIANTVQCVGLRVGPISRSGPPESRRVAKASHSASTAAPSAANDSVGDCRGLSSSQRLGLLFGLNRSGSNRWSRPATKRVWWISAESIMWRATS
jgi:hypothetical protein